MVTGTDTVCSPPRCAATATTRAARVPIAWHGSQPGGLADQLFAEWRRLRRSRSVLEHARALGVTTAPFHDLDELLRLAGFGVAATDESEAVLAGLARHAHADELAARIVLQRILPGLLTIAGAEQRRDRGTDALTELVGEAWVAIRRYRCDRRPTAIAARLLNDARHRAFTSPRRRRRLTTDATDVHDLPAPSAPPEHPFVELTALLAVARDAGLAERDLVTVRVLIAHDSVNEAAVAEGVSSRALRYRRRDLVARLQSLVLTDGATGTETGTGAGDGAQAGNTGGRLARNAAIPSCASGEAAAALITAVA